MSDLPTAIRDLTIEMIGLNDLPLIKEIDIHSTTDGRTRIEDEDAGEEDLIPGGMACNVSTQSTTTKNLVTNLNTGSVR